MQTVIMTDSSSDLPLGYIEENNIPFISLTCHFKGKDFVDDFGKTLDYHEFYEAIRAGEMPSTSQVNVQAYVDKFREYAKEGAAVIYIGFSSGLSGSLQSAQIARKTILDEYKQADITVIDSKSASLGQGLLVYYAHELLKKGAVKDEIVAWVEENKLKVNHWFTVDSLEHLKRGGRISGTAAAVGSILNIKPVLKVDDEGKLTPVTKVQGRKKSLRVLADMLEERIVNPEEQVIAISHGDCIEDVNFLENILREKFACREIIINQIGPVIGSHSGPGTLALFFMGKTR
ncbi:MAG: DegV family protein [Peptococcaceae bacterium]|jgi:DegV family protein with EDD domain|nr:DegV family protein [Peptococcaceae bacterium]MDH7523986.1 DegV family protein [Peptococcaceae bacterium]